MSSSNEKEKLIADVREHLAYYRELGVELLDVNLEPARASEVVGEPRSPVEIAKPVEASSHIPRELPDAPIAPPRVEIANPSVKRA